MHYSTNLDDNKSAIKDLEHSVTNIWNIKQRITKKPLPIFIIDLQPYINNKTIYDIESLLQCRIVFEPPRPKRDLPQCTNNASTNNASVMGISNLIDIARQGV